MCVHVILALPPNTGRSRLLFKRERKLFLVGNGTSSTNLTLNVDSHSSVASAGISFTCMSNEERGLRWIFGKLWSTRSLRPRTLSSRGSPIPTRPVHPKAHEAYPRSLRSKDIWVWIVLRTKSTEFEEVEVCLSNFQAIDRKACTHFGNET